MQNYLVGSLVKFTYLVVSSSKDIAEMNKVLSFLLCKKNYVSAYCTMFSIWSIDLRNCKKRKEKKSMS
jgi:hypothetical protein